MLVQLFTSGFAANGGSRLNKIARNEFTRRQLILHVSVMLVVFFFLFIPLEHSASRSEEIAGRGVSRRRFARGLSFPDRRENLEPTEGHGDTRSLTSRDKTSERKPRADHRRARTRPSWKCSRAVSRVPRSTWLITLRRLHKFPVFAKAAGSRADHRCLFIARRDRERNALQMQETTINYCTAGGLEERTLNCYP